MLIYTLPLIGALIGWLTNYIAIKMLFHPRDEVRIFFIPVQGVFPKRQKDFARKLGQIVSEELISVKDLTAHLKEKATSEAILNHIAQRLEEGIASRLPRAFPMLAMFMSGDMAVKVKGFLLEQIGSMQGGNRWRKTLGTHGQVVVSSSGSDALSVTGAGQAPRLKRVT